MSTKSYLILLSLLVKKFNGWALLVIRSNTWINMVRQTTAKLANGRGVLFSHPGHHEVGTVGGCFFLDKHIISIGDISPDAIPKRFSHHSR